jgi:hypothetical protein
VELVAGIERISELNPEIESNWLLDCKFPDIAPIEELGVEVPGVLLVEEDPMF